MKNLIILVGLLVLPLTTYSQGVLHVGYGHNFTLKDDRGHKFHTVILGGERTHVGISMEFDIRKGNNDVHDIYPHFPKVSVDTRWVVYWKVWNFDIGPYGSLNSTSFDYDGWTAGAYLRFKVEPFEPIGFFIKGGYPLIGKHRHWKNKADTGISLNSYSHPTNKYRSDEIRLAIGAYIKIRSSNKNSKSLVVSRSPVM